MIAFFRLIRVVNLLMIALTQYLVRFCIIEPIIKANDISVSNIHFISNLDFFLLVLSSVLIAAAGYIINDYYDIEADNINRPGKIVIGNKISAKFALFIYWLFNIAGVLIGFYLANKLQVYKLGLFNLVIVLTLWFYSTNFKKQLFTGNFVIAFLTAFVIIIIWVFEFFAISKEADLIKGMFYVFRDLILPYSIFAFIISFIREVIKDIEDREGDEVSACRTFPIEYGIKKTKILLYSCIGFVIALLTFFLIIIYSRNLFLVFWYLMITVELPLFYLVYLVHKAETKDNFSFLSGMLKILMFAGILSMQAFYL